MDFQNNDFKTLDDLNESSNNTTDRKLDVNVWEREDEYIVQINLVGFDKDEVVIYVEEDDLYVEANRQDIVDEENENYFIQEHNYSYCQRSFSLKGINKEDIVAYYENEFIYIHLPKKQTI